MCILCKLKKLPQEIKLVVYSYSYRNQNKELLEDIQTFVQYKETTFKVYEQYFISLYRIDSSNAELWSFFFDQFIKSYYFNWLLMDLIIYNNTFLNNAILLKTFKKKDNGERNDDQRNDDQRNHDQSDETPTDDTQIINIQINNFWGLMTAVERLQFVCLLQENINSNLD
jgi:hypothetical protein